MSKPKPISLDQLINDAKKAAEPKIEPFIKYRRGLVVEIGSFSNPCYPKEHQGNDEYMTKPGILGVIYETSPCQLSAARIELLSKDKDPNAIDNYKNQHRTFKVARFVKIEGKVQLLLYNLFGYQITPVYDKEKNCYVKVDLNSLGIVEYNHPYTSIFV